jgi:hypothetical protein
MGPTLITLSILFVWAVGFSISLLHERYLEHKKANQPRPDKHRSALIRISDLEHELDLLPHIDPYVSEICVHCAQAKKREANEAITKSLIDNYEESRKADAERDIKRMYIKTPNELRKERPPDEIETETETVKIWGDNKVITVVHLPH